MTRRSKPTELDQARLLQGAAALGLVLSDDPAELRARRNQLRDACAAMQSLDDLGAAKANVAACEDANELLHKLADCDARLAKLGIVDESHAVLGGVEFVKLEQLAAMHVARRGAAKVLAALDSGERQHIDTSDWAPDEPVDGSGLNIADKARAFAEALNLTEAQRAYFCAEFGNSLVPALESVRRNPDLAVRCLRRAVAVLSAVKRYQHTPDAALERERAVYRRLAELDEQGERARAVFERDDAGVQHATLVRRANGATEDPLPRAIVV